MANVKAIIAAGGKGTRLRPLTFTSNKHLLPIANKPLLLYALENIAATGIKQVGIIVNESREGIEALLGNGSKWGVDITYIVQKEALGLAHVVKIARNFIGKSPFVYQLGDNIFTKGIKKPYLQFVKNKPDALLSVVEHEENFRLGVPYFDNDKLVKVVEKPKNPPNKFGVPGLYFFSHHVFEAFSGSGQIKPSQRGEFEIGDLYNYLIDKGYRIEVAQVDGQWLDPGKFDDSLEANRVLLELNTVRDIQGEVDSDSKIMGKVSIGAKSVVKNCQIYGPSSIGQNVYLEGSYIGPYSSIDDNCRITGSAVENSIIMSGTNLFNCKIRIESSMIGKNSIIKAGQSVSPSLKMTVSDMSVVEVPQD